MTTLRDRIRLYWRHEDYPETPEWYDPPRWVRYIGALLVMAIAFVATAPLSWALLAATGYTGLSIAQAAVIGLVLIPAAAKIGRYLAAPLVDHLFGIPREADGL